MQDIECKALNESTKELHAGVSDVTRLLSIGFDDHTLREGWRGYRFVHATHIHGVLVAGNVNAKLIARLHSAALH